MRQVFQLLKSALCALAVCSFPLVVNAEAIKFGLPIQCELNKECFIQNLPDMIIGEGMSDSFCQNATYEGHKGFDIRVMSLKDIEKNIPVIAPQAGTIKATRDGEEDILLSTPEGRKHIKGKECGNGLIIAHEDGYESQLCHLKQNSIIVTNGDTVEQGDILGYVGNSGAAEFPHVHMTLRKDGQWIDPISGSPQSKTCSTIDKDNSIFDKETAKLFTANTTRLMTSGITGNVIEHSKLVRNGAPRKLRDTDTAIVGWAWFINIRKDDQIRFLLEGPQGVIAENTTKPFDRNKATYSGYSGKRGNPEKGEYRFTTTLLRDGKSIEESLSVQILE